MTPCHLDGILIYINYILISKFLKDTIQSQTCNLLQPIYYYYYYIWKYSIYYYYYYILKF